MRRWTRRPLADASTSSSRAPGAVVGASAEVEGERMSDRVAVYVTTRSVGQGFATCGVVRRVGSGLKLAETRDFPYGFVGSACESAELIATQRGWRVVRGQDDL